MNHRLYAQAGDDEMPVTSVIGAGGFIGRALHGALSADGIPAHAFTRRLPFRQGGRLHPALMESTIIFYLASSITPAVAHQVPERVAEDKVAFRTLLDGLRDTSRRPL